jgi:hypothetical protein
VGDPEALEQLCGARAACVGDIPFHGHVREEGVLLEDEADAPLLGWTVDPRRGVEEHALAERDSPALGTDESCDRSQDARLAGAGRADEREGLAPDRKR